MDVLQANSVVMTDEQLARAFRVHLLLMHVLFPLPDVLQTALHEAERVLDGGSGAGMWVVEQARQHPRTHYLGIDRDSRLVELAHYYAASEEARNATFLVADMNHLDPVIFPPDLFDYIHLSFLAPALLHTKYGELVKSLFGKARPGSWLVWTECEFPVTSSRAFQRIIALICKGLDAVQQRYEPPFAVQRHMARMRVAQNIPEPPRHLLNITPYMSYWLREANFSDVHSLMQVIDVSAHSPEARATFVEQSADFFRQVKPFLTLIKLIEPADFDRLVKVAMKEMQESCFCGLIYTLTVYGQKPG